jgi:hypothetical protein
MKAANLIWVKDFGAKDAQWDLLIDAKGNLVDDISVAIDLVRNNHIVQSTFIGQVGLSDTQQKNLDNVQWDNF